MRTRGKLQNPGIWVEDGYYLTQFQEKGWSSLFNSSSDFLNFGTRLLSAVVQNLTIVHYPTDCQMFSLGRCTSASNEQNDLFVELRCAFLQMAAFFEYQTTVVEVH